MHSDEAYVTAAESAMHQYTNLVETLNTMPELHAALKNSLETECDRIDEVDRRTIDLLLEDFENSGVHLEKTDVFITLFFFVSNFEKNI
jgi:Zn-dependent oligopeptidase